MGSLKPGATYIYERADGIVYAREVGADPSTRIEVGRNYDDRTYDGRPLYEHIRENQMWGDIRRAAESNPILKDAVDRVIMLYELTKSDER